MKGAPSSLREYWTKWSLPLRTNTYSSTQRACSNDSCRLFFELASELFHWPDLTHHLNSFGTPQIILKGLSPLLRYKLFIGIHQGREFREQQKKYFDLVDQNEQLIVQRGKDKAYVIVLLDDVDRLSVNDDVQWNEFLQRLNLP